MKLRQLQLKLHPSPDGNGILLYLVFLQDIKDRMYSWKKLLIKL